MECRALTEARSSKRGAMVLSATLALGGCQLASCDDMEEEKNVAPLSTLAPAPTAEREPLDPDLEASEARVAELDTSPGFTPDPMLRTGITAGGPVDANRFDDRCRGWIAAQPDVLVRASRPFAELVVMAASSDDITLLVVGPDGEARCGDDDDGTHPVVRGFFEAGTHRVWVGAQERGVTAAFVLGLSELDDSLPSSLPR